MEKSAFAKQIEKIDQFQESSEYRNFRNILNREISVLKSTLESFKNEIQRIMQSSVNFKDNISQKKGTL